MNVTPLNFSSLYNNSINFEAKQTHRGTTKNNSYPVKPASQPKKDVFEIEMERQHKIYLDYLSSFGIKIKTREDGYYELSNLNAIKSKGALLDTERILPRTKVIHGSTDFGAARISDLGSVELLQGSLFKGKDFDFSTSKITDFGNLQKINGNMIISPEQLDKMNFEGLEVTGKISVATEDDAGSVKLKQLSDYKKDMLLHGFTILRY